MVINARKLSYTPFHRLALVHSLWAPPFVPSAQSNTVISKIMFLCVSSKKSFELFKGNEHNSCVFASFELSRVWQIVGTE
jgi:hypothetical protein